jgi:phosphoribosylaminoimidazolecarboxamide formyltransferase / IMP cyclohydrolase
MQQNTALFSLDDTEGVEQYAAALIDLGWTIVASSETSTILNKANLPCVDVSIFTGVQIDYGIPPTLHPKIENALTMDDDEGRIELVYNINYALDIGNDVGGHTLLALAAKGNRLPVTCAADMEQVIEALQLGGVPLELRQRLVNKTNAKIAQHYVNVLLQGGQADFTGMVGRRAYNLMNGENPYQEAALYSFESDDALALAQFENLSQTPPCMTNLADVDCIVNTISLAAEAFREQNGKQPFITVAAKHGNPCGMAVSWEDPLDCIEQALFGNPIAVWGGEVITNFPIDEAAAHCLRRNSQREKLYGSAGWMLDVVVAPDYSEAAVDLLRRREYRKIYKNPALETPAIHIGGFSYRFVRGGVIRQSPPWRTLNFSELETTAGQPSQIDIDNLIIAWAAAYTSFHGGNEIAVAKDRQLIGVGGGPSTVQAAQVAVLRTGEGGHDMKDSVFSADAFFPFTDAPQILIDGGVKLGSVPAGGRNEKLVRDLFVEHNIMMFYLQEDFRGFCRH